MKADMGVRVVETDTAPEGIPAKTRPLGPLPAKSGYIIADDGTRLHYARWSAGRKKTRGVLVFCHGIASHGLWFGETAGELSEQGFPVIAPDRRGSGQSGGPGGHIPSYKTAIEDLRCVIKLARSEHPDTPIFLVGSSWAAKLVIVYAERRPSDLAGLILMGPGLFARVDLPLRQKLGVLFGNIFSPQKRYPIPLTPELYTRNPKYVEYIRKDPLRILEATTRFYWETRRLDRMRNRIARKLSVPLLVMQGTRDDMMNVKATRGWLSNVTEADTSIIMYPEAGHTLDFEKDPSQYRADLLGWLNQRAALFLAGEV